MPQSKIYQLAREGSLRGTKLGKHHQFQRKAAELSLGASAEDRHSQNQYVEAKAATGLIETFDIDEHASLVSPFNVRRNQISKGRFHSKLSFVKMPGMVVYEDRWLRQAESYGASPEGAIMLLTNVAWQRSRIDWCGGMVDHRRFAYSAPGSEIRYSGPENGHYVLLLVEPELLAGALGSATVDRLSHHRHIECCAVDGERLIAMLMGIVRKYVVLPELLDDPREVSLVQSRLYESLSKCFTRGESNNRLEQGLLRYRAVDRAIQHLVDQAKPITALELAVVAGASQRTLENGFRERIGITPGAYLRAYRLNKAHHDLFVADPRSTTVTTIAQKWGFDHPGRFSVAHHELFGETPFKTLRRARPSTESTPLRLLPSD